MMINLTDVVIEKKSIITLALGLYTRVYIDDYNILKRIIVLSA